ncbi:MAG: GAF domain-containing protein, partial [Chloroflexota bacterium]
MSVDERIQPNIGNHSKRENEILPISYLNDFTLLERLQALTNANLIVSSELDLDTVLQRIADTARQFANAAYAAVGILDEYGSITSFITSGISKEEREKIGELPHGHGLLGVLIRQGKALRVGDMSKDPRRSGFPPNHPLMTSLLGVPISLQDQVIGDLYLTDKFGFDEFSAADEWWLTLFARQAAVAVQNAHHYKRVQISHQRAQTLAELAGTLNQSIDPEELFQQITQASCRLLELPASALYLLDSGGTHFEMQSQYGLQESLNPHRLMSLDGSIAGKVLANGIPVAVSDTSALQEVLLQPLHNGRTPRSLLVVPIRCHDQVSGVIEVYS